MFEEENKQDGVNNNNTGLPPNPFGQNQNLFGQQQDGLGGLGVGQSFEGNGLPPNPFAQQSNGTGLPPNPFEQQNFNGLHSQQETGGAFFTQQGGTNNQQMPNMSNMEGQSNSFEVEESKGSMKALLIPSLSIAVVLLIVGVILYRVNQAPPKQEVPDNNKIQQEVSNQNNMHQEYESKIQQMQADNEAQLELLKKENEELKEAVEQFRETVAVTPPKADEGTTPVEDTPQKQVVTATPNQQTTSTHDVLKIDKKQLGVTSNSGKDTFKIIRKQVYILPPSVTGLPYNTTSYVFELENAKGLVIPMYTTYNTYSNFVEGTELKVEYLIYTYEGKEVYDIFAVEK